jgi:two-component system, OmpR family, response regulator
MKSLLLVDSDAATLAFLREKLDAPNLRIRAVLGGDEAMTSLRRESYDLVLCALEMPGTRGVDVLSDLRGRGTRTPVLFLTRTLEDATDAREALRPLAPCDILDRPVFLNHLYERIEFLLHTKIEWRERRLSPRHPVQVDLMLTVRGRTDTVISIRSRSIDLSLGGLQFERRACDVCTGYDRGGIHSDCILARYAVRPGGEVLTVSLLEAGRPPLLLRARAAWTLIEDGTSREFVGMKFEPISADERTRLRDLIERARAR